MFVDKCRECGEFDTDRVELDTLTMGLDELRKCNECKSLFVNSYQITTKKVIQ